MDLAVACLDGGARLLQIRSKHAPSGWLLECVAQVVERASFLDGVVVIVNDRADVARLSGAAGVHLGQDDLSPEDARRIVGARSVVGKSTHTLEQVEAAAGERLSHIAIGPVFGTTTKKTGYAPVGLARVEHAVRIAAVHDLPVVAIGGITLERAADAIACGAQAVAVISDLLGTGDPAGRVRAYLRQLSRV